MAGPAVVLRDLEPRDRESAWELDQRCFEPGIAYSNREMSRFLTFATRIAIVAQRDGRIDGFCIGYLAPGRPGLQGFERLGRQILRHLIAPSFVTRSV